MTIQVNISEPIVIRPSSVDTFFNCSYQWAKTFLEGIPSIPGNRAAIGTAIHRGAETVWTESIKKGSKVLNLTAATDAAVEEFEKLDKEGVQYDEDESKNTSIKEVVAGTTSFLDDIATYVPVPLGVEERFTVDIANHPIVKAISGTVDYRSVDTIADLKTSKRKATTSNYTTQQSVYRMLANENNAGVKYNNIQNVVLKKEPEGQVLPIEVNVDQAKFMLNSMLDTLEIAHQGRVALEVLFRGNPKYYLCDKKYCAHYNTCPFVKGSEPVRKQVTVL
jgi:hypothetical protein